MRDLKNDAQRTVQTIIYYILITCAALQNLNSFSTNASYLHFIFLKILNPHFSCTKVYPILELDKSLE